MVGAALILPDSAFAEKNDLSGEPNSHKEHVQAKNPSENTENTAKQANVPAKAENVKPVAKKVVVPEQASQRQNGVKQKVSHIEPKQAASPTPVAAVPEKSLPVQAKGNGYGLSNSKKTEKTVNAPGQEKSAAVQESKKELGQNTQVTTDEAEPFSEIATVENNTNSTKLVNRVEPQVQVSDFSKPKEDVDQAKPLVTEPPEKENVPSSKKEIPDVDQAINPTQRSNNSGGLSNDRVSQNLTMISFLEKWFEWKKYYEIKLVQPYLSRYAFMNNQWVNAPPSPPPQAAPSL